MAQDRSGKGKYFGKSWGECFNSCTCRIPSGYQLEGSGSGQHHTSLECYFPLSRPRTGLKLDYRGSNSYLGGDLRKLNSVQNQHCTGPPVFDGVAGDGEGLVGLLCRGWTRFGRGSRRCKGRSCQHGGRGGGDGLSVSPRNVTAIYRVMIMAQALDMTMLQVIMFVSVSVSDMDMLKQYVVGMVQ